MQNFKDNIVNIYGEKGRLWLQDLPKLISDKSCEYNLSELIPVSNMSFNYVVKGYQESKPIILKLGLDYKALAKEAACLNSFSNHGAVGCIDSSEGFLLLEQAIPGSSMKECFQIEDAESSIVLSNVIKELHKAGIPKKHNFYYLEDLLKALDGDLNIPNDIFARAKNLRKELLNSSSEKVLLHGDLHHENILKNDDKWVVIDPKGFIGDPIFDVCAFLSNPYPELLKQTNPKEIINNRVILIAKLLGYSEQRIRDWHYVHTVLCWAWCLDDGIDSTYWQGLVSLALET
ncbi:MAG: aminoglycoside phosphotransferase family protein [Legionellaceae bacterium]|nr:aminoglycoside phosphotransferase family protein [Legionellaceae bacterium]